MDKLVLAVLAVVGRNCLRQNLGVAAVLIALAALVLALRFSLN